MTESAVPQQLIDIDAGLMNVWDNACMMLAAFISVSLAGMWYRNRKNGKIRKYNWNERLISLYYMYGGFLLAQSAIYGAMIGMNKHFKGVDFENGERFYQSHFNGNVNLALRAHMDPMFRGFYFILVGTAFKHLHYHPWHWTIDYFAILSICCNAFVKDSVQTALSHYGGEFLCFPNYTDLDHHLPMIGTVSHHYLCSASSLNGVLFFFHMVIYCGLVGAMNFLHVTFEVEFGKNKNQLTAEDRLDILEAKLLKKET